MTKTKSKTSKPRVQKAASVQDLRKLIQAQQGRFERTTAEYVRRINEYREERNKFYNETCDLRHELQSMKTGRPQMHSVVGMWIPLFDTIGVRVNVRTNWIVFERDKLYVSIRIADVTVHGLPAIFKMFESIPRPNCKLPNIEYSPDGLKLAEADTENVPSWWSLAAGEQPVGKAVSCVLSHISVPEPEKPNAEVQS